MLSVNASSVVCGLQDRIFWEQPVYNQVADPRGLFMLGGISATEKTQQVSQKIFSQQKFASVGTLLANIGKGALVCVAVLASVLAYFQLTIPELDFVSRKA